jgi:PAS domain-containing protein
VSQVGSDRAILTEAANAAGTAQARRGRGLPKAQALQNAILTSATFSIIATDEQGIIQLFNTGAEQMLGYEAAEVVNKLRPSDIHDPQEVWARARALSLELDTAIEPGFEALAFKASRGIEDIYRADLYLRGRESLSGRRVDHGAARRLGRDHRIPADQHRQLRAQARRIGAEPGHGRSGESQPRQDGLPLGDEP